LSPSQAQYLQPFPREDIKFEPYFQYKNDQIPK